MLTTTEAAALLGIKPAMARRHCKEGRIEAVKVGNTWITTHEAVEAFKAIKKRPGRPITRPSAARKDTMMQTYSYTTIGINELRATDLREIAAETRGCAAYRITIYENDQPKAETADALYGDGRLGIAWGADATWADVKDLESGIEMWLNDGDAWEAAN